MPLLIFLSVARLSHQFVHHDMRAKAECDRRKMPDIGPEASNWASSDEESGDRQEHNGATHHNPMMQEF
jgi:hypothetical protein